MRSLALVLLALAALLALVLMAQGPGAPGSEEPLTLAAAQRPADPRATEEAPVLERPQARRESAEPGAPEAAADLLPLSEDSLASPPAEGFRLYGRIETRDDSALDGEVTVVVYGEEGALGWGDFGTRGGSTGSYELRLEEPQRVLVVARTDGYLETRRELTLPWAERSWRVDLLLEPERRITVLAETGEGRPLVQTLIETGCADPEDLWVAATPSSWAPGSTAVLDGFGSFDSGRTSVLLAGAGDEESCIGVLVPEPDAAFVSLVLDETVLATLPLSPEASRAHFTIDPGTLRARLAEVRFRVEDPSGRPVRGKASVSILPMLFLGKPLDARGAYVAKDVPPGRCYVGITGNGFEERVFPIVVHSGESRDLGVLRLAPARTLEGRVADTSGNGCRVLVRLREQDSWAAERTVNADRDGRFEFREVGDGPYWVDIVPELRDERILGCPVVEASPRIGGEDELWLVARPAPAFELVRGGFSEGTLEYDVFDDAGRAVRRGELLRHATERLHLIPGRYTVRLRRADLEVAREWVVVGEQGGRYVVK